MQLNTQGIIYEIKIITENNMDSIIVKIIDNGMGMNSKVKEKIFDKFYREQSGMCIMLRDMD